MTEKTSILDATPDSDVVRLIIPIDATKIDREKRLVRGVATAEVLDSQGEIVDYDTAKDAFARWQGNIREMHQPVAVGKAVAIAFDDAARQITVESYISKGAPDTWEKVLDGTLSMYSIGGTAAERRPEKVGDAMARRLFLKDLIELSLVDNGACPTASFALVKSVDGHLADAQPAEPESAEDRPPVEKSAEEAMSPVAAPEPYDLQQALAALAVLEGLLANEAWAANTSSDPAAAAVEAEQVGLLRAAIDLVIEFFASEHDEQFALPSASDAEAVAMFRAAVIVKIGRRNSANDLKTIQAVHDHAVKLGAACATEKRATGDATTAAPPPAATALEPLAPPSPAPSETVKIVGTLEDDPIVKAMDARLAQAAEQMASTTKALEEHQATVAAQAGLVAKLEERLAVIEAQPMPGGPVTRAFAKTLGGPSAEMSLDAHPPAERAHADILRAYDTLAKAAASETARMDVLAQKAAFLRGVEMSR